MVRNNLLLRLIKKHPTFTFVLLALFLLAIIIGPAIFIINQRFGTGMFYGFFTSHNLDYYHYVSIIRQGIEEGGLLFRNQFSDPWRAKVLYMPIYSFFGLVARVIAIDQFQMYFFTRIISVAVFIALIALFIQNTYQKKSLQIIALLFSFLATSYYNIACLVGCEPIFPVTYSDLHFNAFYRLLVLPPHHYLAVVFLILNVFFIVRFRMKVWWLVIYLLSCVLLVLLHPYIGFVWAFMYGFYVVLSLVLDRKVSRSNWFLLCLTGGVIMLFELITQRSYGVMVNSFVLSFNPAYVSAVPLRKFVEGMGYIMVPFLLSVLLVNKWRHNHFLRFCLVWVAVPFLAPFLPYMSSILGTYRLFQSLPQIPAAIFAVVVVASVYQLHKILGAIVAIACVLFLACTMAIHTLPHLDRLFDDYVEVSEHRILLETRALLEPYRTLFTKKDVIVAPENVALVIPALVQAHVINGHKGNTERFQERAWLVNAVYQSSLSETDFVQFLKDFHVTYVLWGYHAPPLVNSAYQPLGLWQEVKKKDPYSLVSINQSMKNLYLDK